MTRQQKIDELLKDNPPINSTKATEHISEMEIFQQKAQEQIERLQMLQSELLNNSNSDSLEIKESTEKLESTEELESTNTIELTSEQ